MILSSLIEEPKNLLNYQEIGSAEKIEVTYY